MNNFSERKGITPVRDCYQIDSMDDALRNTIWSMLQDTLWEITGTGEDLYHFCKLYYLIFIKKPIDEIEHDENIYITASDRTWSGEKEKIRRSFFQWPWNRVYDFLEFIINIPVTESYRDKLIIGLNNVLQHENAGYTIIGKFVCDITNPTEAEEINLSLARNDQFSSVSTHLETALMFLSDRDNPSYRNSIKESISAVESMASIYTGKPNTSFTEFMNQLERDKKLHGALKEGFKKLYGYTSDENGIRHSLIDDSNLTKADARYFLVTCSAFTNYLKTLLDEN